MPPSRHCPKEQLRRLACRGALKQAIGTEPALQATLSAFTGFAFRQSIIRVSRRPRQSR